MTTTIEAIYREGVFVPQTSTEGFQDGQQVIVRSKSPSHILKTQGTLKDFLKRAKELPNSLVGSIPNNGEQDWDYKKARAEYLDNKYL